MPARKRRENRSPKTAARNPPLPLKLHLHELAREIDNVLMSGISDAKISASFAKTFATDEKGRGWILALRNALRNAQKPDEVRDPLAVNEAK